MITESADDPDVGSLPPWALYRLRLATELASDIIAYEYHLPCSIVKKAHQFLDEMEELRDY